MEMELIYSTAYRYLFPLTNINSHHIFNDIIESNNNYIIDMDFKNKIITLLIVLCCAHVISSAAINPQRSLTVSTFCSLDRATMVQSEYSYSSSSW